MNKITKFHSIPQKLHKNHSNAHFANFVPSGIPFFWTHCKVGFRHFAKEYSLPLIVTVILILLIAFATAIRFSQRSTLADILTNAINAGQDYGALLSKDKTDELKKNSDTDLRAPAPAGSSTSFAINAGGGALSGSNTPLPGASSVSLPVFGASMAYFQKDATTLECSTPKPRVQTCSKKYVFSGGIRTQNGPGTVNYGWRSNIQSANADASFNAGGGEVLTPIQKIITLACRDTINFSLQLTIALPTQTQSAVLSTNHNCNEI